METYTYTIFDGNPAEGGPTAWPTYTEVEIMARTPANAVRRVEREMRREGRDCGAYERGARLWYLIWDSEGLIIAEGSVTL